MTDEVRSPDADNPKGYFEFEPVKHLKNDASWLPTMRGKAIKVISQLLYDLPASEQYLILFMERDLDEVLMSQELMLQRLRRDSAPREEMKRAYHLHLARLHDWLTGQPNIGVLHIHYRYLLDRPHEHAEEVCRFIRRPLDLQKMAETVDRMLYRNRK